MLYSNPINHSSWQAEDTSRAESSARCSKLSTHPPTHPCTHPPTHPHPPN
jgi:hypothetical protein